MLVPLVGPEQHGHETSEGDIARSCDPHICQDLRFPWRTLHIANDTILLTEYLSVDIATRERRVSEVHLFSLKPGEENTSIISSM